MNQELKRKIILKHYQQAINRGYDNDEGYIRIKLNNESCVDEIYLIVKFDNNLISDIRFKGDACSICIGSTSIMISLLLNKTKSEAKDIITSFENMIEGRSFGRNLIGEAIVFEDIAQQANRKKCALMSWQGIKKIL